MSKRKPNPQVIEFLQNRRSVLIKDLAEPGPNNDELKTLLTIATRVPDHRKLEPWRLLVIRGEGREKTGQKLANIRTKNHDLLPIQLEIEANNFKRAPLVIAVVACPQEGNTPLEEQTCSGCSGRSTSESSRCRFRLWQSMGHRLVVLRQRRSKSHGFS